MRAGQRMRLDYIALGFATMVLFGFHLIYIGITVGTGIFSFISTLMMVLGCMLVYYGVEYA